MKRSLLPAAILVTLVSAVFLGCNTDSKEPTASTPGTPGTAAPAPTADEPSDATQADQSQPMPADTAASSMEKMDNSDMDKMTAELAKLSPEDRASAEKQHFCPVSGKMLGTMGEPYKVEVQGQQVWLCCSGCESQLRENPDEYLAKITK
ncbi:MAG: hypothetical protein JJ992_08780 [Planctomycetes bacterium]|nr:hypothetical protein [Planctomycetota bacterium]